METPATHVVPFRRTNAGRVPMTKADARVVTEPVVSPPAPVAETPVFADAATV